MICSTRSQLGRHIALHLLSPYNLNSSAPICRRSRWDAIQSSVSWRKQWWQNSYKKSAIKSIAFSLVICISSAINGAWAEQIGEASILFSLPAGWSISTTADDRSSPTMDASNLLFHVEGWSISTTTNDRSSQLIDASNPLFRAWKGYRPILANGQSAMAPGLNITAFNVPPNANIELLSRSLTLNRGWPIIRLLTSETYNKQASNTTQSWPIIQLSVLGTDGLSMQNSFGYLTEFSVNTDTKLKAFVIHAINHGKFVEIILSATSETFQKIEPELRYILRSFRADINRSPITLKKIESILPADVTISSVTATPLAAQLSICVRHFGLTEFLQLVAKEIGLFHLTKASKLYSSVQLGQENPIQYDLLIYGDTSHLKNIPYNNICQ
ncbi:MAG: hypothetical protein PHD65_07865 [Gallionella sp.]|nr:hypothetical protein [Gallionella sp.]